MKSRSIIISAMCTLFFLTSCRSGANDLNIKETDGAELVPISQIYDGYADAAAQCKKIILPSVLGSQSVSEVYTFDLHSEKKLGDAGKSEFTEFLKTFLDTEIDENKITKAENFDDYIYDQDGISCAYREGSVDIYKSFKGMFESNDQEPYTIGIDNDKSMNVIFPNTDITLGDYIESLPTWLYDFIKKKLPDFDIQPYSIKGQNYGSESVAMISWLQSFKGVPLMFGGSTGTSKDTEEDGITMTEYDYTPFIDTRFENDGSLCYISLPTDQKVTSSKKLDKIISLADAAKILENELADNICYEIDDVILMYFGKTKYPIIEAASMDYDEMRTLIESKTRDPISYHPEWVFVGNAVHGLTSSWFLRVNAITGEITLAAPRGAEKQRINNKDMVSSKEVSPVLPPEKKDTAIQKQTVHIIAQAKSYKDSILTFEYDNKEYSLSFLPDNFTNSFYHLTDIGINEKIINNKFGIPVKADIEITDDMTEIINCDVETINGAEYVNYLDDELSCHMYRDKGSVFRIQTENELFYVDLNGLDNIFKTVAPEDTNIYFEGVILNGDKLVTSMFCKIQNVDAVTETGDPDTPICPLSNNMLCHYLGTVISVSDDAATVKLNYTGKELTVPAYLSDGEIRVNDEVAITLRETPEELATSTFTEISEAVFYTDIATRIPEGSEFKELAYFKTREGSYYPPYVFTKTEDIK